MRFSASVTRGFLSVCVVAVVFGVIKAGGPPAAVPADGPATEFSAERAIRHVRAYATEPHPAGTPANDRVREYILKALSEIGVEAEVDTVTYSRGFDRLAEVSNVLARIPGTSHTKAFALMAHYDSTMYGPGAADDGSGVSTMLETARAIKAGPPLMNDVLFIFTDAEERGLTGARAFGRHPWAEQVGVLLNMETRGTSGPSGMFETTENNGWLIRELVRSGVPVRGSSLGYDIYRRMPTRTDLSALKNCGFQAYNIAFVEDFPFYHTPNDNADNLSLESLQHDGAYALGLARHLGNMPLSNAPREPDTIFFNILGSWMVWYPARLGAPLAVAAALVFAASFAFGIWRGRLSAGGLVAGMLVALGAAAAAVAVAGVIVWIAYQVHYVYILYDTGRVLPVLLGFTVLIGAACFRASARAVQSGDLVAGTLALWVVVMVVLQAALPHGAYAALWPLAAGSLGLLVLITGPRDIAGGRVWAHALFGLPAVLLVVPSVRGMSSSLTLILTPLLMAPVVMVLGLYAPQLRYVFNPLRRITLVAAAVVLAVMALVSVRGARGPESPIMNSVSYGLDRVEGKAWWMSTDKQADEWTSQFFPPGTMKGYVNEFAPYEWSPRLKAPAPVADLAAPTVEVVSDAPHDDGSREVTVCVTSHLGVPELSFEIEPPVQVLGAAVDGQELRSTLWSRRHRNNWAFYYEIFPRCGSATVNLLLRNGSVVKGKILEKFYGLPALDYAPRPPHMINKPNSLDWFEKNKMYSGCSYIITPFEF